MPEYTVLSTLCKHTRWTSALREGPIGCNAALSSCTGLSADRILRASRFAGVEVDKTSTSSGHLAVDRRDTLAACPKSSQADGKASQTGSVHRQALGLNVVCRRTVTPGNQRQAPAASNKAIVVWSSCPTAAHLPLAGQAQRGEAGPVHAPVSCSIFSTPMFCQRCNLFLGCFSVPLC